MKFVLSVMFLIQIAHFCKGTEMNSSVKIFFNNVLEALKEKFLPIFPQFLQSAKVFVVEGMEMGKYFVSELKRVAKEGMNLATKEHELIEREVNLLRSSASRSKFPFKEDKAREVINVLKKTQGLKVN